MSAHTQPRDRRPRVAATFALVVPLLLIPIVRAQSSVNPSVDQMQPGTDSVQSELQVGTRLTRAGHFSEAIPHLLAVRDAGSRSYAAEFNLALCYVATHQAAQAIPILTTLRSTHEGAQIENLLAQSYIGVGNSKAAFEALKRAAKLAPGNEKLYLFVADACTESKNYDLGLEVVELGLQHLPNSASLHYQRAMFLSELDEFDAARNDFALAKKIGAGTGIGYLAAAQESLTSGKIDEAIRATRDGLNSGYENYQLLTILGEGLLRSGVTPDQPEFAEAETALKKAVTLRPNYSEAQLALGKLNLISHRLNDSISHLEQARALDPHNAAIYSHLAAAYRESGDTQKAEQMLSVLAQINREQVEKISSAPGERKPIPGASTANRR